METENTKELANHLASYYTTIDKRIRRLVYYLIRELAKGEPVPPARVAELMGMPVNEAEKMLTGATLQDDQGRVIGFGLSLTPTEHIYEAEGHKLYTWCAVDSIAYPQITDKPAHIESSCAVTGEPIELELTPEAVKKITPESAVVSILAPDLNQPTEELIKRLRQLFCSGQLFFKSAEVAKQWRQKHPELPVAAILPVRSAFELYKQLGKELWLG